MHTLLQDLRIGFRTLRRTPGVTLLAVLWLNTPEPSFDYPLNRRGLTIACAGLGAGLMGALLANRLLRALRYAVSPADGVTLAVAAGVLLGVAWLAIVMPAHASTRVGPLVALRTE